MTETQSEPGIVETRIRDSLTTALNPESLEIINESHLHQHHSGSPGTGESHFRVKIVAACFSGLNRLARHRLVNDALAAELAGPVHALAIKAHAPGE